MKQNPWTLYWQSDSLDSCVATRSSQDALAIDAFWQNLATVLEPGSCILDLATGNGTVPAALLDANPGLQVTGVDKAAIDPLRFLSAPGALTDVDFRGDIDICSLPFVDGEFDAVTSQFGLEYAPLRDSVREAGRVLKGGGQLRLVMHHADSAVVRPAGAKRREMDALLKGSGVLQALRAYVTGTGSADDLEATGQAHLASEDGRSRQITGQIFEGINRCINSVNTGDQPAANELCSVMLLRLRADRDRLRQLEDAALTQNQFDEIVELFKTEGVNAVEANALYTNEGTDDEFVIGWQYCGQKD